MTDPKPDLAERFDRLIDDLARNYPNWSNDHFGYTLARVDSVKIAFRQVLVESPELAAVDSLLRAIGAATDLQQARRRANKALGILDRLQGREGK